VGNFTGDGTDDALVGALNGEVYAIDGATGITFWEFTNETSSITTLDTGDFNQDRIDDALIGSAGSTVYALDGSTGRIFWINTQAPARVTALAVSDLNGDTIPDAVVGSRGNVYVIAGMTNQILWDTEKPWEKVQEYVVPLTILTSVSTLAVAYAPIRLQRKKIQKDKLRPSEKPKKHRFGRVYAIFFLVIGLIAVSGGQDWQAVDMATQIWYIFFALSLPVYMFSVVITSIKAFSGYSSRIHILANFYFTFLFLLTIYAFLMFVPRVQG